MTQSKYSDIESPYIRRRIVATAFEEREVIDDLVWLHQRIRSEPTGAFAAWAYDTLRKRHYGAWLELLREYDEDACADRLVSEEQDERRRRARCEQDQREEEVRARAVLEDWIRAGGLPPASDRGESR